MIGDNTGRLRHPGAGRKRALANGEGGKRVNVFIDAASLELAATIAADHGETVPDRSRSDGSRVGNVSAGIRIALQAYAKKEASY